MLLLLTRASGTFSATYSKHLHIMRTHLDITMSQERHSRRPGNRRSILRPVRAQRGYGIDFVRPIT